MAKKQEAAWYSEEAGFFGPRYYRDYTQGQYLRDTKNQVDFIVKTLGLKRGNKILDLACGHGRHSIELAKRGCKVVGQDLNGYFLEQAKKDAKKARVKVDFTQGDMREIGFENEFDAVLNLFTAFGYLESDNEDQKVLFQISKALKKRGKLFIDLMNRERVIREFQQKDWMMNKDGSAVLIEHEFDLLNGRMLDIRTWIEPKAKQKKLIILLRLYTLAELNRMLNTVGLKITNTFGDYQGSDYEVSSRRLIVLGQKVK